MVNVRLNFRGYSTGTLKKVKQLKVLDSKVAQNISILLGGSLKHMEYDEIKRCLLKCDDEILTANVIEQLIQVKSQDICVIDILTSNVNISSTYLLRINWINSNSTRTLIRNSQRQNSSVSRSLKSSACCQGWNHSASNIITRRWYKMQNQYVLLCSLSLFRLI